MLIEEFALLVGRATKENELFFDEIFAFAGGEEHGDPERVFRAILTGGAVEGG